MKKKENAPIYSLRTHKALLKLILFFSFTFICQSQNLLWQKNYSWGQVSSMEFSQDSRYLAVYLSDLVRVDIIRVEDSTMIVTIPSARLPKFTPDGRYIATVNGKTLTLTSVETWETFKSFDLGCETDRFEFSYDMSFLACSGGNNGAVLLFDTKDYKLLKKIDDVPVIHDPKYGDRKGAQFISVSFDNKKIAYSNAYLTFVYDLTQDSVIMRIAGRIPKFSPVRNELFVIKMIKLNGNSIADGLNYYKFESSDIPDHLSLLIDQFDISNDGNYIIRFGTIGSVYITQIKDGLDIINCGGQVLTKLSKSQRYLATLSGYLYMLDLGTILSVNEPRLIENFNVTPNPANDNLLIAYTLKIPGQVEIKISNINGSINKTIKSEFQTEKQYTEIYPIADFPNGTYFITLKINEKIYTQKINIVR